MDASFLPTSAEYLRVGPEMVLIFFGALLMVLEAFAGLGRRENLAAAFGGIAQAMFGVRAERHRVRVRVRGKSVEFG